MEKLNRAQKCSILGPQNLGSRRGPGPRAPPGSAPVLSFTFSSRYDRKIHFGLSGTLLCKFWTSKVRVTPHTTKLLEEKKITPEPRVCGYRLLETLTFFETTKTNFAHSEIGLFHTRSL